MPTKKVGIKMTKKRKTLVVLPWVLLLIACGPGVRRQYRDWSLQRDLQKHGAIQGVVNDVRFLGERGPLTVATFRLADSDKKGVMVRAFDENRFLIVTDPRRNDRSMHLSIVGSNGEVLLESGDKEGLFPGWLSIVPQSGPDAHVVLIHDGDMDGVFEKRMRAPGVGPDDQGE